ncbi:MAG: hypothetical protein PPP58_07105 [Natronomonas sp.]
MDTQSGSFRVYRVVEAVKHLNFQQTTTPKLYSVHSVGYADDRQALVDSLDTGDLVEATLEGDREADSAAWRVLSLTRTDRVPFGFAVDVAYEDLPTAARALAADREFGDGDSPADPAGATLTDGDDAVGECWIQPRSALPDGAFVPNVLTGVLPLEPWLTSLPNVGEPAAEVLVIDPAGPTDGEFSVPFGVFLFFTEAGAELATEYRDRYGCPRDVDSRPAFDPY